MCACTDLCIYTYGSMNMCVHMCLEIEVHIVYLLKFPYALFFVSRVSHRTCSSLIWIGQLASELQGSTCSVSPVLQLYQNITAPCLVGT